MSSLQSISETNTKNIRMCVFSSRLFTFQILRVDQAGSGKFARGGAWWSDLLNRRKETGPLLDQSNSRSVGRRRERRGKDSRNELVIRLLASASQKRAQEMSSTSAKLSRRGINELVSFIHARANSISLSAFSPIGRYGDTSGACVLRNGRNHR